MGMLVERTEDVDRLESIEGMMAERTPRGTTLPHLRAWRERAVLSQTELATRAGFSRSTIARAETGQHIVEWPNIRKLAKALHITARQLIEETPQ